MVWLKYEADGDNSSIEHSEDFAFVHAVDVILGFMEGFDLSLEDMVGVLSQAKAMMDDEDAYAEDEEEEAEDGSDDIT